jgi:hypothetical protein
VADAKGPVGLLFGAAGEGCADDADSRRLKVAAVQVKGVPQIAVDEALWMVASTLR